MAVDGIGSATSTAAAAVQATDGDAKSVMMLKKAIDQDGDTAAALLSTLDGTGGKLNIQA
jgi:hypothetical protein